MNNGYLIICLYLNIKAHMTHKVKINNVFFYIILFFSTILYLNQVRNFEFYNDDFTMLEFRDRNYLIVFFQTDAWWRPLKNIFYNYFNNNYYELAFPIVATKIIIHSFLTFFIFKFLKNFTNNINTIILTLIFFFSQSGIIAVVGVDTLGQLLVVFFGLISFFFTYHFIKNKNNYYLFLSFIFILFSFLAKEIAITFVFINLFTIFFYSNFNFLFKFSNVSYKKVILITFLYFLLVVSYLYFRNYIGATWQPTNFGEDRYSLGLGFNLIKNIFLYFLSLVSPIDNTIVFVSYYNKYYIIIFFLTIFFISLLYYLLKKFYENFDSDTIFRFLLLILSSFPIILLNNIGELYTYTSVFFLIFFLIKIIPSNHNFILIGLLCANIFSSLNKIKNIELISLQKNKIDVFLNSIKNEIYEKDIYVLFNNSKLKYSYYNLPSFDWIYPIFQFQKNFKKRYWLIFDNQIIQTLPKDSIILIKTFDSMDGKMFTSKNCVDFYYSQKKTICNY